MTALLFARCGGKTVSAESNNTRSIQAPIVLVHGYKGSALVAADSERRYPTLPQVLGLGSHNLALDIHWTDAGQSRADGLHSAGMLDSIVVVPKLYEVPIYGPFVDAARARGRSVYAFHYDWRRDNFETLAALERFVAEVSAAHGNVGVELIGHSLGGFIALTLVKHAPEHVARLVLAGAPLAGGVGFLSDMIRGEPVGLNRRVLAPSVVATFASVYAFFPLVNQSALDARGQLVALDFYQASDWTKWRIGVFAAYAANNSHYSPGSTGEFGGAEQSQQYSRSEFARTPNAALQAHLQHALASARRFRELSESQRPSYPPTLVIQSRAHPTLATAIYRDGVWDLDSAPRAAGDGRVKWQDTIPAGVPNEIFETSAEHGSLLNDPGVIARILN